MSHSNLDSRLRGLEESRGAGMVKLSFVDGSTKSFFLRRDDWLAVLLASFDLARAAQNPAAQPSSTPRAQEIARLIAEAVSVSPRSQLWDTISGIVRQSRDDAAQLEQGHEH